MWSKKGVRSEAGRPPRPRALAGALVSRATRKMTYREREDQIRYYAPARYLCGLTETTWSPDANTIQDFEQLLGEDGVRQVNEQVVKWAVAEKVADPRPWVADTTAQEAAIPYPSEVGHLSAFVKAVVTASKKAGKAWSLGSNGALRGYVEDSFWRRLPEGKGTLRILALRRRRSTSTRPSSASRPGRTPTTEEDTAGTTSRS